jgi:serine/threonine-protein kinase RsbW
MADSTDSTANDPSHGSDAQITIELDLPLHHRHASTARIVAASLGADLGLTVDEIEDLRLGVNEAVSILADVDAQPGSRLHLRFEVSTRSMTVICTRHGVDSQLSIDDVDDLAVRILRAVVDDFRVDAGTVVVTKHAVAADVD